MSTSSDGTENPTRPGSSWTVAAYDMVALPVFGTGAIIALILLIVFFLSELFIGRLETFESSRGGSLFRLTIIHCLLAAYVPTAYAYLVKRSQRTVEELRTSIQCTAGSFEPFAASVGRYPWWGLALAGALVIAVGIPVTISTSPGVSSAWSFGELTPETRWHRVLSPFFSWYIGCLGYAVVAESRRLERIGRAIRELDLLDLDGLASFSRQGLSNAALMLGTLSLLSLFLFEPGYNELIAISSISGASIASICLLLPLRGVRARIRAAKLEELAWCSRALQEQRATLKSGDGKLRLQETIAYKELIEGVREWPFDNPMLLRFALYLLIPLGSWAGGAMVERLLDAVLE